MNFIDLCAGIGGIRLGLEQAGHNCVGFCEFDKYALKAYKAIHDTKGEWEAHDITKVTDEEISQLADSRTIDIVCGGFPCQSFSIAGKRKGFADIRGTIFFELLRFIRIIKPKHFIFENVKGLLSSDGGRTFGTILRALAKLGYCVEWQVLNSKNFGVPQSRERVFIVGHLGNGSRRKIFPICGTNGENPCKLQEITSGLSDSMRVYNPGGLARTLRAGGGGWGGKTGLYGIDLTTNNPKITQSSRCLQAKYNKGYSTRQAECTGVLCIGNSNPSGNGMNGNIYDSIGISPTLTTNKGEGNKILVRPVLTPDRAEKRQNGRRMKKDGDPMFTLTAQDRHGVAIIDDQSRNECNEPKVIQLARGKNKGGAHGISPTLTSNSWQQNNLLRSDGIHIRKLIPCECWRLQGFPDSCFNRAKAAGISDTQLYKQAGNAVTVTVAYAIGALLKEFENENLYL